METIYTLLASLAGFLILIGILVTVHEFGHYYVAKRLGFKVLTFSIGFGKSLWQYRGKEGINYRIGLLPLGGYVEVLDERVHEVKEEDRHREFNAQPLWKRFAMVAAGPAANILLAILLYWGIYMAGVSALQPFLGAPEEKTPFAEAGIERGDRLLTIDNTPVYSIHDAVEKLIDHLGDGKAQLLVERNGKERELTLDLGAPLQINAEEDFLGELGFSLYMPKLEPRIDQLVEGALAERLGLKPEDLILKLGAVEIEEQREIAPALAQLREEGKESITLEVLRKDEVITLVAPYHGEEQLGVIIAANEQFIEELNALYTLQKYPPWESFKFSLSKTYDGSLMVWRFIYRMIKQEIHINTMAGPVTIANVAGSQLRSGWIDFIELLALFSINIGMLNLLPIPVLDGGRLVGFMIEAVVGRDRIPESLGRMTLSFGLFLLFLFMVTVLYIDLTRWF